MKRLILFLFTFCCLLQAAPLWQADFQKNGELDWKKIRNNPADSFITGNGILTATCSNLGKKPNTGSLYETELPNVSQGSLLFEVLPNAGNSTTRNYNNLSLMIRFHGRLVSIRPGWWTYFYGKKGHRRLSSIPAGQWISFKIDFDKKAKTISYYCQDMATPVYVETEVSFTGPVKFQLGNYGLTNGVVVNHIRNVRLEPLQAVQKKARNGAVILRGINFDAYDLDGIITEFGVKGEPVYCDTSITTGLLIQNNFSLAKRPMFSRLRPKWIIMADFPLNGTLEPAELHELVQEVKDGANLLILGGMFTLNRGEFFNQELNAILPVKIGSVYDISYRKDNFPVEGKEGAIAIFQKFQLMPGAKALLKADNAPLLSIVKRGNGAVCVYAGVPGGRTADKGEMIHDQQIFPELLKQAFQF